MPAVELVRFRVAPDKVEALLDARPRMLADSRADRAGFIEARLIRLADDKWLDLVVWRSADDFAASRAQGANPPRNRRLLRGDSGARERGGRHPRGRGGLVPAGDWDQAAPAGKPWRPTTRS
jgi:quinol monooxygenase YgiN